MGNGQALANRKSSSNQLQGRNTGNRGTGQILYHFELTVTADLKNKVQNKMEFHLEVFEILFGPRVFQTSFIRQKEYAPPKFRFDTFKGHLNKTTFEYGLNKKIIDGIGLLPRVKPFLVTKDKHATFDIGGYEGPMSINADLAAIEEDAAVIHDVVTDD